VKKLQVKKTHRVNEHENQMMKSQRAADQHQNASRRFSVEVLR
jgi:hypothetical protein